MSEIFSQLQVAELERFEQQASKKDSPISLTVSADDFSALEERIVRAVEMVKRERQGRVAAEERANQAELELREAAPRIEALEKELITLKSERDHVRQRVERLLSQLDALQL
jgi:50S ribosomal subunit-associated GTPase HflX